MALKHELCQRLGFAAIPFCDKLHFCLLCCVVSAVVKTLCYSRLIWLLRGEGTETYERSAPSGQSSRTSSSKHELKLGGVPGASQPLVETAMEVSLRKAPWSKSPAPNCTTKPPVCILTIFFLQISAIIQTYISSNTSRFFNTCVHFKVAQFQPSTSVLCREYYTIITCLAV